MSSSTPNSPKKSTEALTNYDYSSALKKWSAPVPPALSRKLGRGLESPLGKVKVMLRVCDNGDGPENGILRSDQRKKQVILIDPGGVQNGLAPKSANISSDIEERRVGVTSPKMFSFDGIFDEEDNQVEICGAAAAELVASAVSGEDGCFISLGCSLPGKNQTMFGRPVNHQMGVVPTVVSWLFKCIQDQRQKNGNRFSVRVSALEVMGSAPNETINDLLLSFVNDGDESISGDKKPSTANHSVFSEISEVRAPSPEAAGFYLDSVLDTIAKREEPPGHFIFTLHLYRYSIDSSGKLMVAARSRLHCMMLSNLSPSTSVFGGLLLSVLNGQRHLPSRGTKLGTLLKECLGSLTCRVVVMIHVSCCLSRYSETLSALQLGSRIHRLRRSRKIKMGSSGTGSGGSSGGSSEEMKNVSMMPVPINGVGTQVEELGEQTRSSDIDPSSSEQSCDTVIYLGPSIDEATDGEHPPVCLPSLETKLNNATDASCIRSVYKGLEGKGNEGKPSFYKSKSPKSKASCKLDHYGGRSGSASSVAKFGKEQWVDGPKASMSRLSCNDVRKQETWIDGPKASRPHVHISGRQSSLPCSPRKMPSNQKMIVETCSPNVHDISSNKAQMIKEWISNHTHGPFVEDSPQDESPYHVNTWGTAGQSAHNSSCPYNANSLTGNSHFQPNGNSFPGETDSCNLEYKPLTVFKTCDEFEDVEREVDEIYYQTNNACGLYEFEFIEVYEPEVPVPTKDACFQVNEEDIALSFLDGDNPLSAHDPANFTAATDSIFERVSSCSISEGIPERNDQHPLRALSEECLAIIAACPECCKQRSNSKTQLELLVHNEKSIGSKCLNNLNGHCMSNGTENFTHENCNQSMVSSLISPFEDKSKKIEEKSFSRVRAPEPPILSDECIFKVPTPIKNRHILRNITAESSDTDQESLNIPPMKILDLSPIRNNIKEAPIIPTAKLSPLPKPKLLPNSKGCDHEHCQNFQNGSADATGGSENLITSSKMNGTGNGVGAKEEDNENGCSSPSFQLKHGTLQPIIENGSPLKTPKSPKKSTSSKTRNISHILRKRSKSPKRSCGTSSSDSGKSSASSGEVKSSSSSGSSSFRGFFSSSKNKSPAKHHSPSKSLNKPDYRIICD